MKKLDIHAASLKILAMGAKSMALLPVISLICAIYSQVNSLSMLMVYLISLPSMALGYLIYYYDPLFHPGKETRLGKIFLSLLGEGGLIALDFLLLYQVLHDLSAALCCLGMILLFFVWGYRAGDGTYSQVLTSGWHIGILVVYGAYMLVTGVMWISSQRTLEINHDPVVLGAMVYGILSLLVINQASVDYELQNQDAESADARKQIQNFNFRLSLILAILMAAGYFLRGAVSGFFVTLFSLIRDGVLFLLSIGDAAGNAPDPSYQPEAPVGEESSGEALISSGLGSQMERLAPVLLVLILIALLILFRKQIAEGLRKTVHFFAGFWQRHAGPKRAAATQYYQDLVEELDQETVRRLFGEESKPQPLRRQLRDYEKETDPDLKVRRALPLLRRLSPSGTPFQEGDTAREMLRRMEGDPGGLSQYGDAYDQVRYGENHATLQQGKLADSLVEKAAQKK